MNGILTILISNSASKCPFEHSWRRNEHQHQQSKAFSRHSSYCWLQCSMDCNISLQWTWFGRKLTKPQIETLCNVPRYTLSNPMKAIEIEDGIASIVVHTLSAYFDQLEEISLSQSTVWIEGFAFSFWRINSLKENIVIENIRHIKSFLPSNVS